MKNLIIKVENNVGKITLNRPSALNALTYEMILQIEKTLDDWLTKNIDLIIIDAVGEKAFCAGGDITDLYQSGLERKFSYGQQFWLDEYRLNEKLFNYPKPIVSFMQGFTMGGGVGLGCHVSHRVVCETSRIAMPECTIGLVPDVGGSYILARAKNFLGEYLATTGYRMDSDDAIMVGFADIYVPNEHWKEIKAELIKTRNTSVLSQFKQTPIAGQLSKNLTVIEHFFSKSNLLEILDSLYEDNTSFAKKTIESIERNSPSSVLCTFDIIRELKAIDDLTIRKCLEYEYRYTYRALEFGDFIEGVRAQVIDKDRSPKWKHKHIRNVPRSHIEKMLEVLPEAVNNWEN